ncbi:MAG: aminopeptidase P family protein [Bacteroidota bacterium]|nr:aminopeptidase P family protein [Bacteroidota bacterium]
MFPKNSYINRRKRLREEIGSGLILFPGNSESAFNYPDNTYTFRQDSAFSYFFGLDHPDFVGVMDIESGTDYIYGNNVDLDDIIWMGPQPSVAEQAASVGVENTAPLPELEGFLKSAIAKGRKVHYLPPYRGETMIQLEQWLGIHHKLLKQSVSLELINAVVKLRSVKDDMEIADIEKMVDVAYLMHTTAMKMAYPGIKEQEISGTIEGISLAYGGPVSFPIILSVNGQTLHNHKHNNYIKTGQLLVVDAGAESELHYASDITRTCPVGGKFNQRQKEVYEIVLAANMSTLETTKPGRPYRDSHFVACETIAQGLKDIGLMKGDVKEAVANGAHAMFMPHGLGHMLGMDVHDMEGIGQIYVGYDNEFRPSEQFGTAFLRIGRRVQPGFVLTNEPGIYFIPELIDLWRSEGKFKDFINYEKLETYKDFGGIRIEDDILVTETGCRVLGKPIPKTVAEVEAIMAR